FYLAVELCPARRDRTLRGGLFSDEIQIYGSDDRSSHFRHRSEHEVWCAAFQSICSFALHRLRPCRRARFAFAESGFAQNAPSRVGSCLDHFLRDNEFGLLALRSGLCEKLFWPGPGPDV